MPPNARRVSQRVIDRIKASEYSLRIYYPKVVTKPTGSTVIPLPVSPLMAKPNPQPVPEEEPTRILPEITLKCLYTETSALSDMRADRMKAEVGGWSRDVQALVRVVAAEADRAGGGTVFDGCDFVEIETRRYKVLNVVRQAASMTKQGTYYVLLTGAVKA